MIEKRLTLITARKKIVLNIFQTGLKFLIIDLQY